MRQVRLLAGRYRVLGRLTSGPKGALWLAEEASTTRPVVVAQVAEQKAVWLGSAVGIEHKHLAKILRIVRPVVRAELPLEEKDTVPEAVAIAELVAGRTLAQALLNTPLPPYPAVRCVAYIASAVDALHRRGAAHGAISQRSVVLERADEGPSPVLTQLNEPPHVTFASPERLRGSGPTPHDDVWALHVLLYAALTGRPPHRGRDAGTVQQSIHTVQPAKLEAAGVRDDRLQGIVDRGLCLSWDERTRSVFDLESELFDWLSKNAPKETEAPRRPALESAKSVDRAADVSARAVQSPAPRTATLRFGAAPEEQRQPMMSPSKAPGGPAIPDLDIKPSPVPSVDSELDLDDEEETVELDHSAYESRPPASRPSYRVPELEAAVVRTKPVPPPPKRLPPPRPVAPATRPEPIPPRVSSPEISIGSIRPASLSEAELLAAEPSAVEAGAIPKEPVLAPPKVAISEPPIPEPASGSEPWAALSFEPGPDVRLPEPVLPMPIPAAPARPKRGTMLAVVAAGVGIGGIVLLVGGLLAFRALSARGHVEREVPAPEVSRPATGETMVAPIQPTKPPEPEARDAAVAPTAPEDVTRCVADYFPDGTFDGLQDLAFVCEHADARKSARIMRSRIVIGARGKVTPAMHEWARLEWHELAVIAILRHGCCPSPGPLDLPPPVRSCSAVGVSADNLAKAFVSKDPKLDERIVQFHRAADCAFYGKAPGYSYPSGPISGGQVVFAGFLKRNMAR